MRVQITLGSTSGKIVTDFKFGQGIISVSWKLVGSKMKFAVEMRYRYAMDENVEKKSSGGSLEYSPQVLHLKSFSVCRAAYFGASVSDSSVKKVMCLIVI